MSSNYLFPVTKETTVESDLIQKLIEGAGAGTVAKTLSEMPGSELHSLLLGVFAQRTQELAPRTIESAYRENRLVVPCAIDQRSLIEADMAAYRVLDTHFNSIELSPVMPLGTNVVLGGVNQKNILGTIRSCEVLADPTTALALECAKSRKKSLSINPRNAEVIRIASSARCMRLQRFDNIPGFVPHFKIFALATGGRDVGSEKFEIESLAEHVRFYLKYLVELQSIGCLMHDVHVALSDMRIMRAIVAHHGLDSAAIGRHTQERGASVFVEYGVRLPQRIHSIEELPRELVDTYRTEKAVELLSKLEQSVLSPLRSEFPSVAFSIDLDRAAGMHYYTNACAKIWATNERGEQYPLMDGGFTDWTQKLLQTRKERLLTSGMGTELILSNFRSTIATPR